MGKFSAVVMNCSMTEEFKSLLKENITDSEKLTPGQLRINNEWYALTYAHSIKYKNFNPISWEDDINEIDAIGVVKFMFLNGNRLIVTGKTSEIETYFQAILINKEIKNFNEYFTLNKLEVDLNSVLERCETDETYKIENVKCVKANDVSVKLGNIKSCKIETQNYDMVKEAANGLSEISINFMNGIEAAVNINGKMSVKLADEVSDNEIKSIANLMG